MKSEPLATSPAVKAHRASIAIALAPILIALAFTMLVAGWIAPDLCFAFFATCTAWVVYEMHGYQKAVALAEERELRGHTHL
jgi:multisubunit Na+/H+ antiporter MnhB subunit